MPSLTITQGTSIEQMQAFARSAGSAEIRAKTDDQGVTTLYTHSKWKPSLNRDPAARALKQQAGRDAIGSFIESKFAGATGQPLLTSLANMNKGGALNGSGLSTMAERMKVGSLEGTLASPPMRAAYRTFCTERDFTGENIGFLDRTDSFSKLARAADTPEKLAAARAEARSILSKYVVEGSPEQINLSSKNRKIVENLASNIDTMDRNALANIFSAGDKEVVGMIRNDSFKRFQQTDLFSQALASL
jgi:hypothetical protein